LPGKGTISVDTSPIEFAGVILLILFATLFIRGHEFAENFYQKSLLLHNKKPRRSQTEPDFGTVCDLRREVYRNELYVSDLV